VKHERFVLFLSVVVIALFVSVSARAQEGRKKRAPGGEAVKMEDLPGAVVDAITREEPNFTSGKISKSQGRAKEGQPAKITYNISGTVGESQVQMSISDDGTVLRKMKQMNADDLPPLVSSGAKHAASPPDFVITGARLTNKSGQDVYEVQGTAGDLKYSITMTPEGIVTSLKASSAAAKVGKGKDKAKRKKPPKRKKKEGGDLGGGDMGW